jgi:hypothetical protein
MGHDVIVPLRHGDGLSEPARDHLIARMSAILDSRGIEIHEVAHGSISLACGFNLTPYADGWTVAILTGAVPIPSHLLIDEIEDAVIAEGLTADEAIDYAHVETDPQTRFINVEGVVRMRAPRPEFVRRVTFDGYQRPAGTAIDVQVDGLRMRWTVNGIDVGDLEEISGLAWGHDSPEQFHTISVGADTFVLRVTAHGWKVQGVASFERGQRYVIVYQQGTKLHPYIRPGIPLHEQQRFLDALLASVDPQASRLAAIQQRVARREAEQQLVSAREAVQRSTNIASRRRAQRDERQAFRRLTDLTNTRGESEDFETILNPKIQSLL